MHRAGHSIAALLLCAGSAVQALPFDLPNNARQTAARDSVLDQVAIPVGPFADGALQSETAEGPVTRRAYRIPSAGLTPLQILAPLRAQLEAAGYTLLLDCDEDSCGGFDFRFGIDVLPAPNMYVNIRAYHFLSARHRATEDAVTLLASTATGAAYLQIIQVGPSSGGAVRFGQPNAAQGDDAPPVGNVPAGDFAARLLQDGAAVLRSLEFAVGKTSLRSTSTPELEALAALMQDRLGLRIAVVGHTDTVGGLDTNIAVSRARARAVRTALIETHGVPGARIEAEGMGYLAPIASNLSAEGREANRRVEVILISDDG